MSTPFLPSQVCSRVHIRLCLSVDPLRRSWREVKQVETSFLPAGDKCCVPSAGHGGTGLFLSFSLSHISWATQLNFLLSLFLFSSVGQETSFSVGQ